MHAIILSIGDELVLGQTVDTNSAWLSAQLARHGIGTLYHQTIADDQPAIVAAIRAAAGAGDLVIVSGGLGPTEDDLTRQALAEVMGSPLVPDAASLNALEAYFARRQRAMPPSNRIQAMRPADAACIPNSCGTAPGLLARVDRATLYVTPGVPREMFAMFEQSILPDIQRLHPSRGVILTTKVNTFGMGESWIGEALGDLMHRGRNPKVGTTVAGGIVSVRVRSEFPTVPRAQSELDATVKAIEDRLGACVFGHDDQSLQQSLVKALDARRMTIATAESCTGGLIGQLITDVPGSSRVYVGGWITYSNPLKQCLLGVPEQVLAEHGAVSPAVAQAMAQGALGFAAANVAIGITGIAGPDGGTPDKPVGLVYLALAFRTDGDAHATQTWRLDLIGDRDTIRDRAAKCALHLVRLHVLGVDCREMTWGRRLS